MAGIPDSWRIQVNEIDESATAQPSAGNTGATVIKAPKGPLTPLYVGRGQSKLITDVFGTPNASYPNIWEAIEANKSSDIWLSAPSLNGLYGGVLVTKTGTIPFVSGQAQSLFNFSNIGWEEQVGLGDDLATNFTFTVDDFSNYKNQTVVVKVDGTALDSYAVTDAEPEVITATELTSGSYTRATGVLDITFDTAPTTGQVITVEYKTDYSDQAYFALFNKNPEVDSKAVINTMDATNKRFTIDHKVKNSNGTYSRTTNSPYLVTLTVDGQGDDGSNIDIRNVLEDDYFMTPVVNEALTVDTFTDDTSEVDFAGGDRGDAITATELALGWAFFTQKNTYAFDIAFDSTADPSIPAVFDDLRENSQKYSAYLLPLPNEDVADAIVTKSGYSISNRGLYFYWNWAKVRNTFTNSSLTTNLMGRVFQKHASMVDAYNGLAPSWIDENGHGGQLGGNILEMVYDPTETQLQTLDESRINPIVFDNTYGVMAVSQRTSLTQTTDYSWIGHSRSADYLISNILKFAIPQQLTKLNDLFHRTQVKGIAELIITPLLAPPYQLLRDALVICDETNNTDDVLARREFVLTVKVKFTPFSETIIFNFVNTPQGAELTD